MALQTFPSDVTRPYVISVDADIPDGASIKVICEGTLSGSVYRQTFVNPTQIPYDQARCNSIFVDFVPNPDTLAAPFLYAVLTEGDKIKRVIDAELFTGPVHPKAPVLMKPNEGRHFLTLASPFFSQATISTCSVDDRCVFEVMGSTPRGTKIICFITLYNSDGTTQVQELQGPGKYPLKQPFSVSNLQLIASPDGAHSPFLYGFAVECGGRRHFLSVVKFVQEFGDIVLDQFWIHNLGEDEGVLTIKPVPPKYDGPPSILTRLHQLFGEGKLTVELGGNG